MWEEQNAWRSGFVTGVIATVLFVILVGIWVVIFAGVEPKDAHGVPCSISVECDR
jgi:hypothetical protein